MMVTYSPRAWATPNSQLALIATGSGVRTYRTFGDAISSTTAFVAGELQLSETITS